MILCCGEALIDMIESVTDDGTSSFAAHVGGAVFNTAIALGRLRAQTGFLSGLSRDMFGTMLSDALATSHVDTSHAILSDRPTTLAFVRLTDGQAAYTFYDENTAGRMLDPSAIPVLTDEVSALYFGGISLISEPCAGFYAALALREAEARVIILDPNIRPGLIGEIETYRARLNAMIEVADILKVSDEDIHWIVPGPASLVKKVQALCDMGPKLVVLTKGREGASAFTQGGQLAEVAARSAKVVDTVGAGDTFNAGMIAKLAERGLLGKAALAGLGRSDAEAALDFGARVAAVTVSRQGANPPWAHELVAGDRPTAHEMG